MDVKLFLFLFILTMSLDEIDFADAADTRNNREPWIKPMTNAMTHSALVPSIKTISIKNHTGVVVCKIFLKGTSTGDNYDLSDSESSFDGNLCTHMVYSFFYLTNDYKLREGGMLRQVRKFKSTIAQYPHLKILADITIYNFDGLEKNYFMKSLTESPENKQLFIKNMIVELKKSNMNGLYFGSLFHEYADENGYDFTVLLKETNKEFQKEGLLVATEIDLYSREVMANTFKSVVQLSRILDFVFLKGFDFYRTEDGIAGYFAPLFSIQKDDENINDNLNYLLYTMGANPNTLILIIPFSEHKHKLQDADAPFYGFNSTTTYMGRSDFGYSQICLFNWNTYWDSRAHVPFMKKDDEWISFENPLSIYDKVQLASQYGLRGIMAQSIDADDFRGKCLKDITYPLLRIIHYGLFINEERKQKIPCPLQPKENITMLPVVFVNFYIYYISNNFVKVDCTADGNPKPEITWYKITDGMEYKIKSSFKHLIVHECLPYKRAKSTLEISTFTSKDEGKYFCRGTSSKGDSRAVFFLTLQDNPLIVADDNIWIQKTNTALIFEPHLDKTSGDGQKNPKSMPIFCMYDSKAENMVLGPGKLSSNIHNVIDNGLCNHLVYTNLYLNKHSYEILLRDKDYEQLRYLMNFSSTKSTFKVILGITIEDCACKSEFLKELTSSKRNVKRFKRSMKNTIKRLNIYGLYLDSSFTTNIDTPTFEKFSMELWPDFKERLLIAQVDHIIYSQLEKRCNYSEDNLYLFSKISQIYNFVFLTGYNFHQANQGIANHNAPIKSLNSKEENLHRYLKSLLNDNEILLHKIVLVVPFFGKRYTLMNENATLYGLKGHISNISNDFRGPYLNGSELWGYNEICQSLLKDQHWNLYWDFIGSVPFSKNGQKWLSFENPKSVYSKAYLARRFRLGGIAVNSINFDDYEGKCGGVKYPLLRAVNDALTHNSEKGKNIAISSANSWGWVIAVVVLILLLTLAIIYLIFGRREFNGLTRKEIQDFKKGTAEANDYDDPTNRPYDASYEINDNYEIDKGKVLGSGAYGIVYSGIVKDSPVAVKCTKPDADKQYLKSLLSEIKILIYLGNHPNIMNLIGASTADLQKGIVYLFVELCPLGNLQDYLRKSVIDDKEEDGLNDATVDAGVKVTLWNMINWSYQIANGLQHLSSKKLVHGDLAARNVLLFEKDVVKLNDFGLSRKLYDYNDYVKKNQEPLPWRWMAIESLRHMTFSVQSDIWSFGITAWEIFSLGETPYPGLSWTMEFVDELGKNMRVQKPKHATNEIYAFMMECWRENPNDRPKPEEVTDYFSGLKSQYAQHE